MTRTEILAEKKLKISEKMIFLFLNEVRNINNNVELNLSNYDIALGVGVDPRNVSKHIKALVAKGYIKKTVYVGIKSNSYEILR